MAAFLSILLPLVSRTHKPSFSSSPIDLAALCSGQIKDAVDYWLDGVAVGQNDILALVQVGIVGLRQDAVILVPLTGAKGEPVDRTGGQIAGEIGDGEQFALAEIGIHFAGQVVQKF